MANDKGNGDFGAEFVFGGNVDFIERLSAQLDELEQKLSAGVSGALDRAASGLERLNTSARQSTTSAKSLSALTNDLDLLAASALDASADFGKMMDTWRKTDEAERAMDELAESAKEVSPALDEIGLSASALAVLRGDADNAKKSVGNLTDRTKELKESWVGVRNIALGLGAVLAGVAVGTAKAFDAQTRQIDFAGKSATNLGLSVESYTGLRYAADRGGSNEAELQMGLRSLSRNAETGNEAFRQLGISVREANGTLKSSDTLFREVGLRLQQMGDRTQAAALAQVLMGDSGVKMISVFGDAPDVLDKTIARGKELGAVFTDSEVKKATEYRDALTNLSTAFNGLLMGVVMPLAPKATAFVEKLADKLVQLRDTSMTDGLGDDLEKMAELLYRLADVGISAAPVLLNLANSAADVLIPIGEVLTKLLEIPGATEAVAQGMMLAFGGVALAKVIRFGTALGGIITGMSGVGGAATVMGSSIGGLTKTVGGLRAALNTLNTAAKANVYIMAAMAAYAAYAAAKGVIDEKAEHKAIVDNQVLQGNVKTSLSGSLRKYKAGEISEQNYRSTFDAAQKALGEDLKGSRWDVWSSREAQEGRGNTTTNYYNFSQTNTIGADLNSIGDLIGKNLENLVRSQINMDVISSRVIRMGGV